MTNPFATQKNTNGAFFKPAEHAADLALMIEPKRVLENQRNEFQGDVTYRDEIVCDITIFRNSQNLDEGAPFDVLRDAKITHSALAGEAREHIGTGVPMLVTVKKATGKNYYVFDFNVPGDRVAAVGAYYIKREAATEAATADAPGFD
ncbi:hypothetical protein [Kribbella italica]|uniref:Uncharacterized protein n=1 Tax=Kribbella italica TaxID=1540520 RepID=A0A7W9J159_9ACTN|nr:hypothetical protein [Kribbella italica]MBB5833394.1 hypothetical protein [Kribbella italica]